MLVKVIIILCESMPLDMSSSTLVHANKTSPLLMTQKSLSLKRGTTGTPPSSAYEFTTVTLQLSTAKLAAVELLCSYTQVQTETRFNQQFFPKHDIVSSS